jgi:UDP-N-acetyl-D-galactosamine dehydrogenase
MNIKIDNLKLAIIGLGYVGLPLSLAFEKKRHVIAYDISKKRVNELKKGFDTNQDTSSEELKRVKNLKFTNKESDLRFSNCYIVTVPTPIDKFNKPDLKPLLNASKTVGKFLKNGDIVIYESTVYPGCIEEKCVPILEKKSKLIFNKEFFCGYSPERINPGDKLHSISNIKKITSGSTPKIRDMVDELYNQIITAGTHVASSIKVAEAAKVIENTQRDLNIAFINELSIIFNKMNIETKEVLDAAASKWNFFPFKPGLVGGHCIGVDPYYLTYKANIVGYKPKIILAGRKLNDNMGYYIVSQFIHEMKKKKIKIKDAKILILGITFKENCADTRNTGVKNVIKCLKENNCDIDVYDPWAKNERIKKKFKVNYITKLRKNTYDGVIIAVAHKEFKILGINSIYNVCKKQHVIYDLKHLFKSKKVDLRL